MAGCLTACLMDPQGDSPKDSQASRTSQAPSGNPSAGDAGSVAFRVALPESAIGRVDSAELRLQRADGTERSWRLSVDDSILAADVAGLGSGPAKIEVLAFAAGSLAYYGSSTWDPSDTGSVGIAVTLGRVGRISIQGRFAEGLE